MRTGAYGGSDVLLVPLQGAQAVGDLQQCGRPQLGATGNEAAAVLHPEAEEGLVAHLLGGGAGRSPVSEEGEKPRHPLSV